MQIKLCVIPNGNKNLHDTMYEIIEKKANFGVFTLAVKWGYDIATFFGEGTTNFALHSIVLPLLKDKTSKYITDEEYAEISKQLSVKFSGETGIVTLTFDGIDYVGIIKRNMTFILDATKKSFPDIIVWGILDILEKDAQTVLDGVLCPISDEKKEAIIKLLVMTYETKLCKLITKELVKEDIALKAKDLSVESK